MWLRRDRSTLPFLATFAVVLVLAYSWVVHFPLSYVRMAYYVPLALVPLVAFVLTRLPRRGLAALGRAGAHRGDRRAGLGAGA